MKTMDLELMLTKGETLLKDLLLNNYDSKNSLIYRYKNNENNLKKLPIVFYFGIAGAGKTSCLDELFNMNKKDYTKLKTSTNRPRRVDEDIDRYNWLDIKSLDDSGSKNINEYREYVYRIIEDKKLEFVELDFRETGYIYGVQKKDLINSIKLAEESSKLIIIEVEVRGLDYLTRIFETKGERAIDSILITPSNYSSAYSRLVDNNNRDGLLIRIDKNLDELKSARDLATIILINADGDFNKTVELLNNELKLIHNQYYKHKQDL